MDHEIIQSHAYHLWEKAGCPHGRDAEFWHMAVEELSRDGGLPPLNGHAPSEPREAPAEPKDEAKPKAAKTAAPKPAVKAAAAAVSTEAKAAAPRKKAAPKKTAPA